MTQIISFLQKAFVSAGSRILSLDKIGYFLVKVAKCNSYVETLGGGADSLHQWIKDCYEEDFKHAFELQVKKAVKRLGVSFVRLAFDITNEPFYGRTRNLYVFNTCDKKYDGEFKYLTACLITRNKQIPIMGVPLMVGEGGGVKRTIELLEYCQALFKKIRFVVFDRGFYISELIDYLEAKKIRYLMLVPRMKGKITSYLEQTTELGVFRHEMKYSKKKSCWKPSTNIVVCKKIGKDKNGKLLDWIFATNIKFKTRVEYVWHYKKRWQIETNYRVEDEAHIKSKSTSYMIRYFYFLISLLLHLFWIVNKNLNYYVQFKKYIDIIEHKLLFKYLRLDEM